MFGLVTFEELKTLYGHETAHSLLLELERQVDLNSERVVRFNPEKRMQLVFDIMGSETLDKTTEHKKMIGYM